MKTFWQQKFGTTRTFPRSVCPKWLCIQRRKVLIRELNPTFMKMEPSRSLAGPSSRSVMAPGSFSKESINDASYRFKVDLQLTQSWMLESHLVFSDSSRRLLPSKDRRPVQRAVPCGQEAGLGTLLHSVALLGLAVSNNFLFI